MRSTQRTIQAIDRAVAIIDLLARHPEGRRLKQLAEQLGLKPQTVQSLLRTLQQHELACQGGRGEPYTLGPRVHQWSRQWVAKADWAATARPIVAELADKLGEYVLLSQLGTDTMVRLVERSADRSLVVAPTAADSAHLHTMATAKVLLAWAKPEDTERIVAALSMHKRGPRSVTSRAKFLTALRTVRRQGFAECIDETAEGVVAVAVPVDTIDRKGALALGVALPHVRYTDRERTLGLLRRAAHDIGVACGLPSDREQTATLSEERPSSSLR